MSINKRNLDTDEIAKESQGNAMPSGTGTHAVHRREAERAAEDRQRLGVEGRNAGRGRNRPRRTICACAIPTNR